MSTGTITAIVVVAVLLVILVAVLAMRRSNAVRDERRRYEAEEHRRVGAVAQAEADRRAAEADARAARAREEQLAAEQDRLDAQRARQEAEETFHKADELDPDVDVDDRRSRGDVRGDADTAVEAEGERRTF